MGESQKMNVTLQKKWKSQGGPVEVHIADGQRTKFIFTEAEWKKAGNRAWGYNEGRRK